MYFYERIYLSSQCAWATLHLTAGATPLRPPSLVGLPDEKYCHGLNISNSNTVCVHEVNNK